MLNFIQVSFCFLLFSGLGLRLGLGLCLGIDNLKNIKKSLIGGAANLQTRWTFPVHRRLWVEEGTCFYTAEGGNEYMNIKQQYNK